MSMSQTLTTEDFRSRCRKWQVRGDACFQVQGARRGFNGDGPLTVVNAVPQTFTASSGHTSYLAALRPVHRLPGSSSASLAALPPLGSPSLALDYVQYISPLGPRRVPRAVPPVLGGTPALPWGRALMSRTAS